MEDTFIGLKQKLTLFYTINKSWLDNLTFITNNMVDKNLESGKT